MAPLRRYLRITKYSVLECRIYLDNPALAHSWLLNHRDPVLPRVIEAVRPLVLPKLREERERSRKKSTKKRGIKDTVVEGKHCDLFFFLFCFLCSTCLRQPSSNTPTTSLETTNLLARLSGRRHEDLVAVHPPAAHGPTG